jgi:3-oxoacyl-[acyl-carrier protein] reductase
MVPGDIAPEVRRRLLPPEIMVQPLLWLVSAMADKVTGARFVASLWDSSLPPAEAAAKARDASVSIVPGR